MADAHRIWLSREEAAVTSASLTDSRLVNLTKQRYQFMKSEYQQQVTEIVLDTHILILIRFLRFKVMHFYL